MIKEEIHEINLKLNEFEAMWLKSLMQNPLCCDINDESEQDKKMRKHFWDALESVELF